MKSKMLEWTGERYLPFVDPKICGAEIHYEHLHRYAVAAQFVKGKKVLDFASGEGYGSYMLSKEADLVIGVEIDENVVKHASSKYISDNLEFIPGSILKVPIEGEKMFDAIICFEAIEHVEEHEELMKEVKRLLRDEGIFIVSSPNKKVYTDDSDYHNPFHRKELYFDEFKNLLNKYFTNIYFFGQSVYTASNLWCLTSKEAPNYSEFVIKKGDDEFYFSDTNRKVPLYFIAVASNADLNERYNMRSSLVDASNILIEHYKRQINEFNVTVHGKNEQILNLEGQITTFSGQLKEKEQQIKDLNAAVQGNDELILHLKGQITNISSQLNEKEQQINELKAAIEAKNEQLRNIEGQITDFSGQLNEKEQQINELKAAIEEKNELILNFEGQIPDIFSQLNEKEQQINELKAAIEEKNELILNFEGQIANFPDQLKEKEDKIRNLDGVNFDINSQLNSIKSSVTWRTVMRWHSFVEKSIPQGTRRRRYYDLQIIGLRTIVNEGFGCFRWKYKQHKSTKKLEVQQKRKEIFKDFYLKDWTGEKLIFSKSPKNPDVSIIIPVYNNAKYTFNSLKSVYENTRGSFELILVDDCSTDETHRMLKEMKNIKIVRNEKNQGFVESCNIGAKASTGKYLFFLNNDAIVTQNWLEPLIETIEREKVGAVGAKLVYPDGKLQEAGGIIWNDASGWNYGRYDDPDKPEYNFVREVDYCSGAALFVRRDLFENLDGFDRRFKPGYYEDVDLCFSIRKLGYKVLYQPKSVIIHFEGITGGTDITSGVKRYQEVNKSKFFAKLRHVLENEHYDPNADLLFSARDRRKGKNILVIDHYVPTFDKDAGSYMAYNLLRILTELGHKVTFIGDNLARLEPYTSIIQQLGVEVIYAPYIKSLEEYLKKNGEFFDIAILTRAHIAINHISSVKKYCNNAKTMFNTIDLEFLREMRKAKIENNTSGFKVAEKMKKKEFQLAKMSDITLVVSPVEKEIMLDVDTSLRIEVISNIIYELEYPQKRFSERRDIIFVGNFTHLPNIDAVKWFVKEIFPLIKEEILDIKLYVVGDPTEEIKSLSSDDIILIGYVRDKDLYSYFEKCKFSIAPLRYGAGIKGKIIKSMSCGLPVVTTSIGDEGIGLVDGVEALIADDPREFADKVVMLYGDEKLWNRLSENSIKKVEKNYSYRVLKTKVSHLIDQLSELDA